MFCVHTEMVVIWIVAYFITKYRYLIVVGVFFERQGKKSDVTKEHFGNMICKVLSHESYLKQKKSTFNYAIL